MSDEPTTAEPIESEEAAEAEAGPAIDDETLERRRLALSEVRQFGDPVLKSRATEITNFGPELVEEAERMVALMQGALGIGLAATQLGLMRRMLVFQAGPDAVPRAIANPEIEWVSEDLVTAEEGCLSLAKIVVDVERPLYARVSAQDLDGGKLLIEAAGLEARVLQHEIDHLDGILILDRTVREQRRGALRALRSDESFDPASLDPPDPEDGTAADAIADPVAEDAGAPSGER